MCRTLKIGVKFLHTLGLEKVGWFLHKYIVIKLVKSHNLHNIIIDNGLCNNVRLNRIERKAEPLIDFKVSWSKIRKHQEPHTLLLASS